MRFSRETKLVLVISVILALVLGLVNPERPVFRIILLLALTIACAYVAKEIGLGKERNLEFIQLRLNSGNTESGEKGFWNAAVNIVVTLIAVAFFGVVTWPPKKESPPNLPPLQIVTSPSDGVGYSPAVKGILPASGGVVTTPAAKTVPKVPAAHPRAKEKDALNSLSNISEGLLRYKAKSAQKGLQDIWQKFDKQDVQLETKMSVVKDPKQRASIWRERLRLRAELLSESEDPMSEASSLRDELRRRFGPDDKDLLSLQKMIERVGDMADSMSRH
jgi:hypothetical protein